MSYHRIWYITRAGGCYHVTVVTSYQLNSLRSLRVVLMATARCGMFPWKFRTAHLVTKLLSFVEHKTSSNSVRAVLYSLNTSYLATKCWNARTLSLIITRPRTLYNNMTCIKNSPKLVSGSALLRGGSRQYCRSVWRRYGSVESHEPTNTASALGHSTAEESTVVVAGKWPTYSILLTHCLFMPRAYNKTVIICRKLIRKS